MSDGRIDWEEIHRRVEAAGRAIACGYTPSPEEVRCTLKKRAAMLACEMEEKTDSDSLEVVEFLLAGERYGIESHFIREVYPLKDYTPLPGVPPFVLGLVNVRGRILSVVDIKKFFDMPDQGISERNKVIIIRDDTMEFGILADAIVGVRKVAVNEMGPPLPTLTGIRREFLKGVTGERMVILDASRILADKNIVIHHEV
jgi:purine-binding chemotaxis protein CheW